MSEVSSSFEVYLFNLSPDSTQLMTWPVTIKAGAFSWPVWLWILKFQAFGHFASPTGHPKELFGKSS